jgi:hypothetical protein
VATSAPGDGWPQPFEAEDDPERVSWLAARAAEQAERAATYRKAQAWDALLALLPTIELTGNHLAILAREGDLATWVIAAAAQLPHPPTPAPPTPPPRHPPPPSTVTPCHTLTHI